MAKISNHTPLKDNQKDKLVYEAVKKQFGLTFIVCFCLRNKRGRFFLINIEHVSKVYPNGSAGVRDISIHIEKR